jgi:hypothetical protein
MLLLLTIGHIYFSERFFQIQTKFTDMTLKMLNRATIAVSQASELIRRARVMR